MKVFRIEEDDEARRLRREHGLDRKDDAPVYGPSPRETLLRELQNAWRPGHPIQTLREEIQQREIGPRNFLAHKLRDAHRLDAEERNRTDDALSHLEPRERLARETASMWKAVQ